MFSLNISYIIILNLQSDCHFVSLNLVSLPFFGTEYILWVFLTYQWPFTYVVCWLSCDSCLYTLCLTTLLWCFNFVVVLFLPVSTCGRILNGWSQVPLMLLLIRFCINVLSSFVVEIWQSHVYKLCICIFHYSDDAVIHTIVVIYMFIYLFSFCFQHRLFDLSHDPVTWSFTRS